jgi:hypothetical protein
MSSALASLQSKGVRLSQGELRLLALLPPNGKRITTHDLAKKFYAKKGGRLPFNSRHVIVGMVRTLQRKIETVKAPPFIICNSERAGPYPMEVWRQ